MEVQFLVEIGFAAAAEEERSDSGANDVRKSVPGAHG
jgi:hypothetical protein